MKGQIAQPDFRAIAKSPARLASAVKMLRRLLSVSDEIHQQLSLRAASARSAETKALVDA